MKSQVHAMSCVSNKFQIARSQMQYVLASSLQKQKHQTSLASKEDVAKITPGPNRNRMMIAIVTHKAIVHSCQIHHYHVLCLHNQLIVIRVSEEEAV